MKTTYLLPTRRQHDAVCIALLSVFVASAAGAQQTSPAAAPKQPTVLLTYALRDAFGTSGTVVLADSTVSYERIPQSLQKDLSPQQIEKGLDALVKTLPAGTIWGKLYLPAAAPGRTWKGDDVAAFAFAQARLFGTVGAPAPDGSIEILGKRVNKDAAPAYVAGLGLKPVYLLTNPKRRLSVTAWSAASEEQWNTMSKDERKAYGEQQAAQIMALSPEERAQVLDQIRQHDKFFDTVKDPLEHLLGHDL